MRMFEFQVQTRSSSKHCSSDCDSWQRWLNDITIDYQMIDDVEYQEQYNKYFQQQKQNLYWRPAWNTKLQ